MNVEQKKTKKIIFLDILTYLVLVLLLFLYSACPLFRCWARRLKNARLRLQPFRYFPRVLIRSASAALKPFCLRRRLCATFSTAIVAGSVTLICIIVASFAGYAISRFKGPYF